MTNLASLPRTFWFYCWGSYSRTLSLPTAHWKGGHPTPRALLREDCFLFLSLATETVSNCKEAASLVDNQNRGISLKPDVTWHSAQSCQGKERIHEKGGMILRTLMNELQRRRQEQVPGGGVSYFHFCCCEKSPWQKIFHGRKGGVGLKFQVTVHHFEEIKAGQEMVPLHPQSRAKRVNGLAYLLLLS